MSVSVRELLAKAAPQLMDMPYETWNFGDSTGFEGLTSAAEVLPAPNLAAFAHGWFRSWATRATPYRRLDCTAPGLAIVLTAERFGDRELLDAAVGLATYLTERPKLGVVYETWEESPLMAPYGGEVLPQEEEAILARSPGGFFVDCLHFDPPFFAALARVTGDDRWRVEAVDQAHGYIEGLQQDSGLFDHFVLDGIPGRTFGPGWGRGQGWALLGLLDVVEQLQLPDEHPIAQSAVRLIERMVALQRPDGHWAVVITDPDSGDEPSTAAFMAAGFWRAMRLGLISDSTVREAAEQALDAAMRDCDDQGRLTGVSRAVMACTRPSHYAHVPRGFNVPWGQGPLVLALCEALES
jgi:unsaturated rhamnogalacturonyl hydrolase